MINCLIGKEKKSILKNKIKEFIIYYKKFSYF